MYPLKVEFYLCVERGVFFKTAKITALVLLSYPFRGQAGFEAGSFH